jgi:hypothetical protein|tara:strand:- start:3876 stop:4100 length:225 start_codon:yes stop_codon:yes gene_type:complete
MGLRGYSKGAGQLKSFIVPCVRKDPAAKIRRTLRKYGANLLKRCIGSVGILSSLYARDYGAELTKLYGDNEDGR